MRKIYSVALFSLLHAVICDVLIFSNTVIVDVVLSDSALIVTQLEKALQFKWHALVYRNGFRIA